MSPPTPTEEEDEVDATTPTSSPPSGVDEEEGQQLARGVEVIDLHSTPPSVDASQAASPSTAEEELARFRRQWQAEVQQHRRKRSSGEVSRPTAAHNDNSEGTAQVNLMPAAGPSRPFERQPASVARPPSTQAPTLNSNSTPIRLMRRALLAYATAVESERSGKLDEALVHYRKAFRLDAHADRLYERATVSLQRELDTDAANGDGEGIATRSGVRRDMLIETTEVRDRVWASVDGEDYRYRAIKERQKREAEEGQEQQKKTVVAAPPDTDDDVTKIASQEQDTLTRLIDKTMRESDERVDLLQARFQPEDEEAPLPIDRLPDEILQHIITFVALPRGRRGAKIVKPAAATAPVNGKQASDAQVTPVPPSEVPSRHAATGIGIVLAGPDYVSVEQLGRVCWKFRLLTRSRALWKMIVQETFYPPQIPQRLTLERLYERFQHDWRSVYVCQPHVRMNGAYIAAYHYTRPGVHADNVWVRVIHVVEFYRSLRFLPDGRVLSLLTTDPPSETVRKMDPAMRAAGVKGFGVGRWSVHPDGLPDDAEHDRPAGAKIIVDELADKTLAGYTFRILLKLDAGRRGRWDRIDMLEYESLNLKTGEVCPLPMNHKKPFHFSPVRSYGV